MNKLNIFLFLIVLISFIGCGKTDEQLHYADKAAGTYSGILFRDHYYAYCTTKLVKVADTQVSLTIIVGESSFTFGKVKVYTAANNGFNINYSETNGSVTGNITGDSLIYSVNSGIELNDVFRGIKQ